MRCSTKPVCDGRRSFGAESMGFASGRRTACIKSARVSVVGAPNTWSKTNRYYKGARIPGQPMNPTCSVLGDSNVKMIASISQSCSSMSQNNTHMKQSGLPDETHLLTTKTQSLGAQHSMNLSNNLQICADLASNKQLESYRRLVFKPERPPRAIDKIIKTQSLSNQNSVNLVNNLQNCADLTSNQQLESYRRIVSKPERPPRAIDRITSAQSLSNQHSVNLVNNLQTCADLASNKQLESYDD